VRISVIIPTYNNAAFVTDAVDSVLRQSRRVDEIVVIDDGSTDDTAERLLPYTSRGVRFVQQENRGVSATRNRGIRGTHGDWIGFLDADDVWEPDKIEAQVACIAGNPRVVLVGGYYSFWNVAANTRTLVRGGCDGRDPRREIAVRNFIGNTSLVLMRRDIVEQLGGFSEQLRYGEDWDMWIRVLERGPAAIVEKSVLLYRWHLGSTSHFHDGQMYEALSAISREAIDRTQPARGRHILHMRRRAYAHAGRGSFAVYRDLPWRIQLWHAVAALLIFPFDETRQRLGLLVRILVGPRVFQVLSPAARRQTP
jgi:glycosyltransferase involved in cell wall biosynthesis